MSKQLDLSVILAFVDKATAPVRRVRAAMGGMQGTLERTQNLLRSTGDQTRKLALFEQTSQRLSEVAGKASEAQARVAELQQQIEAASAAGKATKRLEQSLAAAAERSQKLAAEQEALRSRLDATGSELREAGIDTTNMARAQAQLAERSEAASKAMDRQKLMLHAHSTLVQRFGKSWEQVKRASAWVASAGVATGAAGTALGFQAVAKTAQFERYQVMLETLEGSEQKARSAMAWVSDFTATTPFELDQVTEAYTRLRSYGLDPTNGLLRTLGDTSAAMGKDIMQAVEAVADAITGENERLKEFGIKASTKGQVISYEYTDKQGIQRTLSVNKSDRKAIEAALSRIWNEKYGGGMKRLSRTWEGVISNLKDHWSNFQVMVMQSGPFERLKGRLQGVLDLINAASKDGRLQQWAESFGGKILKVLDGIESVGRWLWVNVPKVVDAISRVASAVGGWENMLWIMLALKALPLATAALHFGMLATQALNLGPALLMVGKAIMSIGRAMLMNPIGMILTGIATAAFLVWQNWDTVKGWLVGTWEWIKGAAVGMANGIKWAFLNMTPVGLVIQRWTQIKTTVGGFVDYITGLPARMLEYGKNIALGLAEGVKGALGSVKDSVVGMADGSIGWVKDKLDIHSPSRVFAELGGFMSEGLAVGINAKARMALDAAGRVSNMLPKALPAALAFSATVGSGAVMAGSAGSAMSGPFMASSRGAMTVVHQNNTFHIHAAPGMDEKALADAVAMKMDGVMRAQAARSRGRLYDEV